MKPVTFHLRIDDRYDHPEKLVYIRPYHRGRRYSFVSTGLRTTHEIFQDYRDERVNFRNPKAMAFATEMDLVIEKAHEACPTPFSFHMWKQNFITRGDDTLSAAFQAKRRTLTSGKTKELYIFAEKKFLEYNPHLSLQDLTLQDLYLIQNWMQDQGLAWATIGIYMRNLRAVYNHLRAENKIRNYPFHKYRIPKDQNKKPSLTLEEIDVLLKYKTVVEHDRHAIDFWKICYLTFGKYPSDLRDMRRNQITDTEIRFTHRVKTANAANRKAQVIPITPELRTLIDTWSNGNDEYVFDFGNFHNWKKRVNHRLKIIGKREGFKIKLTLQTARHAAATKLMHEGVETFHIQSLLMHASLRTTEHYLDSLTNDSIPEFAKKLIH